MEFHAKICLTLLFYVEPSMTIFAVHAYQPSPNKNPSINTALWGSECGVFFYLFRRRFCSISKSKPSTFSYLPWPLLLIGLRPCRRSMETEWETCCGQELCKTGVTHWAFTMSMGPSARHRLQNLRMNWTEALQMQKILRKLQPMARRQVQVQ